MKLTRLSMLVLAGLVLSTLALQLPVAGNQAAPGDESDVVHAHRPRPANENVMAIPVAATSGDFANRPYMHAKLRHSHDIFSGLVMRDFDLIAAGAEAMIQSSRDLPGVEPGTRREDEIFAHMNLEFRRLAERLSETAEDQNLEGSAYVAEKLNATCISCHQYLRDVPTYIELQ